MIDTHCHFDVEAFDPDREAAWTRARAAGVRAAIVPGVEPASWDRTRACALPGERFVAIGVHPQAVPFLDDRALDRGLADLASVARDAGAVAIGECGLDGNIDLARAPIARQKRALLAHIEVARALDLPLLLHVFHAHGDAVALLKSAKLPRAPGVIHSYSGSAELLREYLALGFHVSFAGAVTRTNARRPVASARAAPLDRLLLETDAPDQLPTDAPALTPDHPRRCEPAHLPLTLARLAAIRNEDPAALAAATTANAIALFQLPLPSAPST